MKIFKSHHNSLKHALFCFISSTVIIFVNKLCHSTITKGDHNPECIPVHQIHHCVVNFRSSNLKTYFLLSNIYIVNIKAEVVMNIFFSHFLS